jgi:hypothetical protein
MEAPGSKWEAIFGGCLFEAGWINFVEGRNMGRTLKKFIWIQARLEVLPMKKENEKSKIRPGTQIDAAYDCSCEDLDCYDRGYDCCCC